MTKKRNPFFLHTISGVLKRRRKEDKFRDIPKPKISGDTDIARCIGVVGENDINLFADRKIFIKEKKKSIEALLGGTEQRCRVGNEWYSISVTTCQRLYRISPRAEIKSGNISSVWIRDDDSKTFLYNECEERNISAFLNHMLSLYGNADNAVKKNTKKTGETKTEEKVPGDVLPKAADMENNRKDQTIRNTNENRGNEKMSEKKLQRNETLQPDCRAALGMLLESDES